MRIKPQYALRPEAPCRWKSALVVTGQRILALAEQPGQFTLARTKSSEHPSALCPYSSVTPTPHSATGLVRAAMAIVLLYDGIRGVDTLPSADVPPGEAFKSKELAPLISFISRHPVVPIYSDVCLSLTTELHSCATYSSEVESKLMGHKKEKVDEHKVGDRSMYHVTPP